jgi:two-component system, chemotaxis family, chemotaxis protein CheY
VRNSHNEETVRAASVLIADASQFGRRLTRTMLVSLGVRSITEVADGPSALEAASSSRPDVLITDWDLPILSGIDVIKRIRSPGSFAHPDLPIWMLTMRTERRYVLKALGHGANEFLAKPTSSLALRDRLISALANRRPMVRLGQYYVPKPRAWPPFGGQPELL